MPSSSILLYALLVIWLLPAMLLIAVYCTDAAWDWVRRAVARWNCYWAKRALRQRERAHDAVTLRHSTVATAATIPVTAIPDADPEPASAGNAPYVITGDAMRVPLIFEDEAGRLHVRQWTLGLN